MDPVVGEPAQLVFPVGIGVQVRRDGDDVGILVAHQAVHVAVGVVVRNGVQQRHRVGVARISERVVAAEIVAEFVGEDLEIHTEHALAVGASGGDGPLAGHRSHRADIEVVVVAVVHRRVGGQQAGLARLGADVVHQRSRFMPVGPLAASGIGVERVVGGVTHAQIDLREHGELHRAFSVGLALHERAHFGERGSVGDVAPAGQEATRPGGVGGSGHVGEAHGDDQHLLVPGGPGGGRCGKGEAHDQQQAMPGRWNCHGHRGAWGCSVER